jgi:hypothetical protein
MQISQRKNSNKTHFDFGEQRLKYGIQDSSGKRTFFLDYISIPREVSGELEERKSWFKFAGALWVTIGLVQLSILNPVSGAFWITVGLGCLGWYFYSRTHYLIFTTEQGQVYVIQDKKTDMILAEIDTRRKAQWKQMYGKVNKNGDPEEELARFKWLFEQGIISVVEFELAKNEIKLQQQSEANNGKWVN